METMTLKEYLLGGLDSTLFLACLFFAVIGIVVAMLIESTERNVDSGKSPKTFSWKYLFSDHWKKALLVFLLVYLFIIFTPQLTGLTINTFVALMLGLGFKYLTKFIKRVRGNFYSEVSGNIKSKKSK